MSRNHSAGGIKAFLHKVGERFKSMREGRRSTVFNLSWDPSGVDVRWLTMENETGSVSFPWKSVLAVDAFKRDCLTIDCICLGFETPEGWIEVHEGMNGWVEFLDAVESSLAGFPPRGEWWPKVAFPPFETCHSRLWEKPEGTD